MSAEQAYDVRIKKFGKFLVRQGIYASSAEQACKKCQKKGVQVLGAKKVDKSDVIGWADTWLAVKDIVGKRPPRQVGVLYEDTTIDSVLFRKKFDVGENRSRKVDIGTIKDSLREK